MRRKVAVRAGGGKGRNGETPLLHAKAVDTAVILTNVENIHLAGRTVRNKIVLPAAAWKRP
jgi:hypothetical protein